MYVVKMKYWRQKMSFGGKKEGKRFFQELPFYDVLIEKSRINYVKNIDLLHEIPFYDELSTVKISEVFKRCARSYAIEIIDPKDPSKDPRLEDSISCIIELFKDLLEEIKGFKYQITVRVLLWKHR